MTVVNITVIGASDKTRCMNMDKNDILDERIQRILARVEESMRRKGATDADIRAAILDKILELQREYD